MRARVVLGSWAGAIGVRGSGTAGETSASQEEDRSPHGVSICARSQEAPPPPLKIQPIIIGTAGHIDHGKSSLVRVLTGIDPDRWAEEKERGMTIDLGFARMTLPDGRQVGLVDVPGHERFLRNMVAGATGIDLVLLVVAADDGVMPQTREHLEIMDLLGVREGLLVLNKIDLVEPGMADLAVEELREVTRGTFLEDAPVVRVSATTGEGIEQFKDQLEQRASALTPRQADGVFRMPVQRVFSAKGFGTILTGIPVSGSVRTGDVLEVLPRGGKGKVRGLQAYHESTDQARAGHSTAVNLSDVDHKEVARGAVLATPGYFKAQTMLGASLRILHSTLGGIGNRTPIRLHLGTAEALGEVILLEQDQLEPGEEGLVQMRLEDPVICAPGDHFVLRRASPLETLGGGVILEESRYRLKRFKGFVIDELARQVQSLGSSEALLESHLLRASEHWLSVEDLTVILKLPKDEVRGLLSALACSGLTVELAPGRWIHGQVLEVVQDQLRAAVNSWFEVNPTRSRMDVRDLRSRIKLDVALTDQLLERLVQAEEFQRVGAGMLAPVDRTVELDEVTRERREKTLNLLREGNYQPPSSSEMAAALGLGSKDMQTVLQLLVDEGEVVHISGEMFFWNEANQKMREAVISNCERNGELKIPELRTELGTTRKFLIPVLESFDSSGLTQRRGAGRVLRSR